MAGALRWFPEPGGTPLARPSDLPGRDSRRRSMGLFTRPRALPPRPINAIMKAITGASIAAMRCETQTGGSSMWRTFWFLILSFGAGWLGVLQVPSPAPTPSPSTWELRVHPVGPWYVGDVLSWEVRPPQDLPDPKGRVTVQVDPPQGPQWRADIVRWGIDQVPAAVFPWVWDTRTAAPGVHRVVVRYQEETVLESALYLRPAAERPFWEQDVRLAVWEQSCCRVYYFTNTETQRDLPMLVQATQWAYRHVQEQLRTERPREKAAIVFFPRMLGQGGFMSREMWVTYRDRGPLMEPVTQIVHHEMVHWYQRSVATGWQPSMLVEGLAVYLSRGHYRWGEPLFRRAHAVVQRGDYIPLKELSQDFYTYQHEMAYIQAGALVAYLVERWGWDAFWAFYTGLEPPRKDETPAQALDRQLQEAWGLDLEALDRDFLAFLQEHPATPQDREDLDVMVRLYETFRRYQRLLDPDGYYGTAWLPRLKVLQERAIVTDAIRGPSTGLHLTVELLLQQASRAWLAGQWERSRGYVAEVEALLEAYAQGDVQPWRGLERASAFRRWVAWVQRCGGRLQQLYPEGPQPWARVLTPQSRPYLETWWLPHGEVAFPCPPNTGTGLHEGAAATPTAPSPARP